jgi:hypothetical protein
MADMLKNSLSWEVESALDAFESAVDRKVCAQIDAGACGTSHDWRKAHEAEEKAEEAREALEKAIRKEVAMAEKRRMVRG